MWSLETLGRVRLSKYFYMREFLYSEIANFHGLQNIHDDPDLAIENGRTFCTKLLDPLEETFGRVAVRSGYRSRAVNQFGNENKLNCARNDNPLECHIWDWASGDDAVAGASIVTPWFADQYGAIVENLTTNTRTTRNIDNIVFDAARTSEFRRYAGVLNLMSEYQLSMENALYVSDHMPVWAVFSSAEAANPYLAEESPQVYK